MKNLFCFLFMTVVGFSSCQTSGYKFQKSKLLDATMDPAKSSPASQALASSPNGLWEKAQTGGGSGVGSSCPTCGS